MSQKGKEDGKNQAGFMNTVLSVLSGSRRARSPANSSASSIKSDTIHGKNVGDGLGFEESTPDGVLLLERRDGEATPPPGVYPKNEENFRLDEGPQTFTNGGSSSGFRYFKNDEDSPLLLSNVIKKTRNAGDDSQGKGLSGLLSPVRNLSKSGGYLPDPPFPLSRPVAGYAPLNVPSSVGYRSYARD